MNKINYFFGYLLFRMRNRWKSKKNIVTPDSYSVPLFTSVIFSVLLNFFVLFDKTTTILKEHKHYYFFYIFGCYLISFFYSEYLLNKLNSISENFINHKWNKLPIVRYMYYFIAINIIILVIIIRVL